MSWSSTRNVTRGVEDTLMAKILVVDDNPLNRRMLVMLLGGDGHSTTEAADGADGLRAARAERPHLVISDILMPSMDGFEFVRALRADPLSAATPVIFYTAHHHAREALHLAAACRVSKVLVKPCSHAELANAVDDALSGAPGLPAAGAAGSAAQRVDALIAANLKFAALNDLNVELAAQKDPQALLERLCRGARNLLGARYAVLGLAGDSGSRAPFFSTSGIDFGARAPTPPPMNSGPLTSVVSRRVAWRAGDGGGGLTRPLFPSDYPPAQAYLAVPLIAVNRAHGWLCLADKIGADAFDDDDERMLSSLGALAGCLYENALQLAALQQRAEERENA